MSIRVSCPYCNHAVVLEALPSAGQAVCSRCGDSFPVRVAADPDEDTAGPPSVPLSSPTLSEPPKPTKPKGWYSLPRVAVVGVILLVLGLLAGILYSRKREPIAGPKPQQGPTVTPAAELAGLRYLRPDANVLFAVQPKAILDYAERTHQDPKALLLGAGVPMAVFNSLSHSGLLLDQIDHLAAGLFVGDRVVELRLTLALILRRPLDHEETFLKSLQAERTSLDQRPAYKVNLGGLANVLMIKASPTAWIFGYGVEDLPAPAGSGPISASLREMLTTRLSPETAIWAVADDGRWAEKPGVQLVVGELLKHKDWLEVLAKGRAAVAGLTFENPPRLRLFIRAADGNIGEAIRAYFQKQSARDGARSGGAGEWAMIDLPVDPNDAIAPLKRFAEVAIGK